MTAFRATATGPAQPAAAPPQPQRRAGDADPAGNEPAPEPASDGALPGPAARPTVAVLVERMAALLAEVGVIADGEAAALGRDLHERIAARVAGCRDAVLSVRLGGLQADQRARLRAIAPAPGEVARQMARELDQATLLALLVGRAPGPAATVAARLAARLPRLPPGLAEAALDALHSGTALDRLDRAARGRYARLFGRELPALAIGDAGREVAQRALALEDGGQPDPAPPHHRASEALLLDALRRGDNRAAIQTLAAAALVPVAAVEAAITLRSRRGVVSLAWKAGYSMRAATLMQSQLAGISPDRALVATADGGCPLSRGEILWQIGFLARRLV